MLPNPPADECGLADPLTKEPAALWEEDGRTDPAMLETVLLVDSEPWC